MIHLSKKMFVLFLTLFHVSAYSFDQHLDNVDHNVINKIHRIKGESSLHGSFEARLEMRTMDSEILVTKIISYQDFKFENLDIEEVWTGKATLANNILSVKYLLKKADILLSAEGELRSPEMFTENAIVIQEIDLSNLNAPMTFKRTREDTRENTRKDISETFIERISSNTPLEPKPIWKNLRVVTTSYGDETSPIIRLAFKLLKARVFSWYHEEDEVKRWAQKKEFQSKNQYFVTDPTDYDFYQNNKNVIRVINKIPDTISLVEAIQKRNAYAPSLEDKKDYFEERMPRLHINELGLFASPVLDSTGDVKKFTFDDDSALWTGMYIAAEAMRFKVTNDEAALGNIKRSLSGLMLLMDITKDPKNFARSAAIDDGSIKPNEKFHLSDVNGVRVVWSSVGNNDMFKGLVHGFLWSYLVLPDSEIMLKEKLKSYIARIPGLNAANELQNRGTAYGLRAIVSKDSDDLRKFINYNQADYVIGKIFNIEGNMHIGGIVDWSGVNLGMVGTISSILIAKKLIEEFPNESKLEKVLEKNQRSLLLKWKDLRSTKRDFLTIAARTFAMKEDFKLNKANELDDKLSRSDLEKEWNKSLRSSVWTLREIPINRSEYDLSFDYSLKPDWSLSWWPKLPWKSIKERKSLENHLQGAYAYPLFESFGMYSNFIWKDQAFNYKGKSNKSVKSPGSDYLYMYWMMRYGELNH